MEEKTKEIDWNEIRKTNFKSWMNIGSQEKRHYWPAINGDTRLLYDFFDEEGILINLTLFDMGEFGFNISTPEKYLEDGSIDPFGERGSHIMDITPRLSFDEEVFETRKEAEIKAFTEAFKILEQKLNP
jgi:hypothetical protein